MTQPWSPERVVSEKLAFQLIEDQFPRLAPVELSEFGKGRPTPHYPWPFTGYTLVSGEMPGRLTTA
ncbi:hypothetical protein LOK74_14640 [Brevibacillus humidisoli]|uniref:hypothetical protein n=1 Tax=Brevibacillus humidisoli TaxID=2895522 RepID=UPI001E5F6960|nr:hypothetical protein [Brevibacillus humidisoli]UFJ39306.1 hypothetical protein LOK74_14640 [Brevibacillus humidisoli]